MRREPTAGEIYRHFKGGLYEVKGSALHTETEERLIVYEDVHGNMYVRPIEMFMSEVDRSKYPDAMQRYRFELTTNMADTAAYIDQRYNGEVVAVETEAIKEWNKVPDGWKEHTMERFLKESIYKQPYYLNMG